MKKVMYILCASFLILGTIFIPTISAEYILSTEDNVTVINADSQRLWIIGTITNISEEGFNIISFAGFNGIYISNGWKGLHLGLIKDKSFRIYNSTFQGYLNNNFIIGTAVEQSGPF